MTLVLIVWLVNTVIPSLNVLVGVSLFMLFILVVFLAVFSLIERDTRPLLKLLPFKKSIFLLVVLSVVVPSKETMWYMVGAYGTQKIVENPVAAELTTDGVDVLKELLAKAKRELSEDKPKEASK